MNELGYELNFFFFSFEKKKFLEKFFNKILNFTYDFGSKRSSFLTSAPYFGKPKFYFFEEKNVYKIHSLQLNNSSSRGHGLFRRLKKKNSWKNFSIKF